MEEKEANEYLQSLLNKILHIYTNDSRMFVGEFKCVDNERNIIISQSIEYRPPSSEAIKSGEKDPASASASTIKVEMTSRFLGLIVVPGQYITKIEVEE